MVESGDTLRYKDSGETLRAVRVDEHNQMIYFEHHRPIHKAALASGNFEEIND